MKIWPAFGNLARARIASLGFLLSVGCSSNDGVDGSGNPVGIAGSAGVGVIAAGGMITGGAGAPLGNGGAVLGAGAPGAGGSLPSAGGAFGSGGGVPMGAGGSAGTIVGAGGALASGGAAGSSGMGGAPMGGSGGQGGADTGGFRPCPTNGDPCKILPLGDSITYGIQYDGAYRVELFTKAVAAGKKITFTGSLSNGPAMVAGQMFPQKNEGHSGWTITQVAGLVPSPAFSTIPNIVLLHIGTNDLYVGTDQAGMKDRLGQLVDKIVGAAPNALVAVAKIVPISNASWNATIKTYNDALPAVIKQRADAGKHVILVDLNTGFMPSSMLSSDGVHPQKAGYDFMGDTWFAAIQSYL